MVFSGAVSLLSSTGRLFDYMQDVVKMLVDAGASVSDMDQDGLTALMNAAEIGSVDIVAYLLNKG